MTGRARPATGMTLVEVLVGTVIVSLVVISAGWALSGANDSKHIHAEEPIDAALIAKEMYELALRQDSTDDGDPPATAAAGVMGLDSLDGASFSPPLDASLGELALANAAQWRQDVDLQVFDLSDLDTPSSEDFASASASSSTLYRLTVHVTFRGEDRGTWWWWINP
jgi:type II secretory pathway pseudopilin PulG